MSGAVAAAATVAEVARFLDTHRLMEEPMAGDIPAVLVTHGAQCAEILARWYPEDPELQIAGLLHDIGLLLVPGDELGHPRHGADYVAALFGDRVAGVIRLHVDAQRYLEATVKGYRVTPPPTAAFVAQPVPMTAADVAAFLAEPLADAALELRRADDLAVDESRRERDLTAWVALMERVAASAGQAHGPGPARAGSAPEPA